MRKRNVIRARELGCEVVERSNQMEPMTTEDGFVVRNSGEDSNGTWSR